MNQFIHVLELPDGTTEFYYSAGNLLVNIPERSRTRRVEGPPGIWTYGEAPKQYKVYKKLVQDANAGSLPMLPKEKK